MCYCKGLDLLKRTLCLFLCLVLLFCFFMVPRAEAFVLEGAAVYYAGALIGTVLAAAGYAFANPQAMAEVGNNIYKSIAGAGSWAGKKISALASWAVSNGKAIGGKAIRVGKDLYQAIVDAFNATYSDGVYSISGTDGEPQSFDKLKNAYEYVGTLSIGTPIHLYCYAYNSSYGKDVQYHFYTCPYVDGSTFCLDCAQSPVGSDFSQVYTSRNDLKFTPVQGYISAESVYGGIGISLAAKFLSVDGESKGYGFSLFRSFYYYNLSGPYIVSISDGVYYPVGANDVAYPSDSSLVKMPDLPKVNSTTGTVTYPTDMPYTKDAVSVPYPTDADGVQVPDVPYDKVLDQDTGATVDDADVDTDTDVDNPSKPGEGTDTDTPSDTVDWPTSDKLSLPELIATKFPFSIPFDVARLVGLFEAEPITPVFRFPVTYGKLVDEEIVIDFSDYEDILKIVRWGEIILFVAGLIVITRNYIKW